MNLKKSIQTVWCIAIIIFVSTPLAFAASDWWSYPLSGSWKPSQHYGNYLKGWGYHLG